MGRLERGLLLAEAYPSRYPGTKGDFGFLVHLCDDLTSS